MRRLLLIFLLSTLPLFGFGQKKEFFQYKIKWNFLTVGYSTFSIYTNVPYQDQKVWMFETTAKAAPIIQTFFPVEDRIISFWDPIHQRTLWHEKILREGNYHRTNRVHFNYDSKIAVWWQSEYSGNVRDDGFFHLFPKEKEKTGILENLDGSINDILSAIYLNRITKIDPIPSSEYKYLIFDDNKKSNVVIQIIQFEPITLDVNGKTNEFQTVVVNTLLETSGVFRSKGKVRLWISNDERRVPLKMEATIPHLGKVEAILFSMDPHP